MSKTPVKALVDCSLVGALDVEAAAAHAQELRQNALLALANDNLDAARVLLQDAKDAEAAGTADSYQLVDLDEDELAELEAHRAEQADLAAGNHAGRLEELVARCDRYLAQTDWIMVPAVARPVDMSATLAQACDANRKQWKSWRSKVKAIRDAASAGSADPDKPGFPDPPKAPAVALT